MGLAVKTLSLEEYLSNPAYEHFEYIEGQPVELNVGNKPHSRIQSKCCRRLDEYFDRRPGGYVAVELRCRLKVANEPQSYLPDIAVVLGDEDSSEIRFLDRAPDLVVEIRSPDDSLAWLHRKIRDYFANGAKLAWVILPEERSVLVFTPEAPTRTVICGEILDGGELLPELQIPVDALFA
jgi:Uma2 family endonuclease